MKLSPHLSNKQNTSRSRYAASTVSVPSSGQRPQLPNPAKIESPYGTVQATWAFQNDEVVMRETLEIHQAVIPPQDYAKVRDFFELVAGVHSAPLVFTKQ